MKNKKGLIIGIVAFLLGIAIALSVCFIIFNENAGKEKEKNEASEKNKNKIEASFSNAKNNLEIEKVDKKDDPKSEEVNEKKVVKLIDIELTSEQYAIGVDKDQPELLAKTNDFIRKIKNNGTLEEICNKYFGDGEPTPVYSAKEDPAKDQLVVATNAAFAPFEYKEGDAFYGIDMEIAALLADELGLELVIMDMDFNRVCYSVENKECDIVIAGLTINEERKESVKFTDSYYEASQRIIALADDETFDDCKDAAAAEEILNGFDDKTNIGYQKGTTAQFYVHGDADWGFDGFKVTGKGYTNGALAVQDLINGNIDYVIVDTTPAKKIIETYNH